MKNEEIVRMAREAGLVTETHGKDWIDAGFPDDCLFDFAALVAAHEREACAKVCDELQWYSAPINFAENCAKAIRARGEK